MNAGILETEMRESRGGIVLGILLGGCSLWLTCGREDFPKAWVKLVMFYDLGSEKMMLFESGYEPLENTTSSPRLWSWQGKKWVLENEPTGLPLSEGSLSAYNPVSSELIMVAVTDASTWSWDGKVWKQLHDGKGFRIFPRCSVYYNPLQRRVEVLRDGEILYLDSGGWRQSGNAGFPIHGAVCGPVWDGGESRFIVWGYLKEELPRRELTLCEVRDKEWSVIAREGEKGKFRLAYIYGMVFDEARQRVILVGSRGSEENMRLWELIG
jgi:hypothetical protein